MNPLAVGVDLGGTFIKAALVERGVGIVREAALSTEAEKGPAHVISRIASVILEMRTAAGGSIAGVGVGAPGGINWNRTILSYPPNIYHHVDDYPWIWMAPGLLITMTVLSINFIGDGLRDAFDPRSIR